MVFIVSSGIASGDDDSKQAQCQFFSIPSAHLSNPFFSSGTAEGLLIKSRPMHRCRLSPAQWLFLLAFCVRLYVIARLSAMPFFIPDGGDMKFYSDWGLQVAHGIFTDHQAFYGLPGYPFILGVLFKILSFDKFWVSIVAGLIQALADSLTAVLIWKLALEAFAGEDGQDAPAARAIGGMAAVGWAFYQPSQAFTAVLMPTALAVAAFWYCVWELTRRRSGGRFSVWAPWLPIGLLIGFQAMIVATILFLIPLALAAIWRNSKFGIRNSKREIADGAGEDGTVEIKQEGAASPAKFIGFRAGRSETDRPVSPASKRSISRLEFGRRLARSLAAALLLIAGLFLGCSPCWLHNYFVAREPVMLSAHSGLNFYIGNNPIATGYPKMPPGMSAAQQGMLKDSITMAEKAEGRPLKHYQVSQYWSAKAHDYIAHHRMEWLRLMAKKFVNFWNSFQYDDLSLITLFSNAGVLAPGPRFGLVAALAIPGLVMAVIALVRGRRHPGAGWIVAAVLLHMAALMPVFVTERYRLAAVPGLLLLAAYGAREFWGFLNRAQWAPATGCACAGLAAAFWVATPPSDPGLWSLDYYNTGIKAMDEEDYTLARHDLETAYRYVPGNAEVNFALGLLWQQKNDVKRSETFYARALDINPRYVSAWSNLGVLAGQQKVWPAAVRLFQTAAAIDPSDAKTHYLQARACAELGRWDDARTCIDSALRLDPGQKEFRQMAAIIETRGPMPVE
jgi:Flp pilus assembly protein TadD